MGGINTRTVRRMVSNGHLHAVRLPGSRLIMIDLNEVDDSLTPVPAAGQGDAD
jgi:excisionase family DNA binding protein